MGIFRMKYLLDTSIYSQPLRRKPEQNVLAHWAFADDSSCCISVVTKAEVEWGLLKAPSKWRDKQYREVLLNRVQILQSTQEIWDVFSQMKARQLQTGQPIGDLDLLIAATARHHGLQLATLNVRDFRRIEGLSWVDWSK